MLDIESMLFGLSNHQALSLPYVLLFMLPLASSPFLKLFDHFNWNLI